eukprot:m.288610 g.288610  ORF g.288610 m.288610 type:complete len:408 (-) comp19965_c0_seq1:128-1351(-)
MSAMNAFIDVGWNEQLLELVVYTAKLIEGEPDFVAKCEANLQNGDVSHIAEILSDLIKRSAVFYQGGKPIEGIFNSLSRLVCMIKPDDAAGLIKELSVAIAAEDVQGQEEARMKALGNLFNTVDLASPSRFDVYMALLSLVKQTGNLSAVRASFSKLDTWVDDWQISTAQVRELFKKLYEITQKVGDNKQSCEFLRKLLASFEGETPEALTAVKGELYPHVKSLVASTLADPEQFSVKNVTRLKAVQLFNDDNALALLSVFQSGDIPAFKSFVDTNKNILAELKLDPAELLRKTQLKSLTGLCAKSDVVDFKAISSALEIAEEDVEMWVIDSIRVGLIEAKVDQVNSRINVTQSHTDSFGDNKDWAALKDRLAAWQKNLSQCQRVLNTVKVQAEKQHGTRITQHMGR